MVTFTTRFSEPLIEPLDQLAAAHGLSRNAYLEHLAQQAVQRGFIPIRNGEGLSATSPSGATITLVWNDIVETTGQAALAKNEQLAFVQARKHARNGEWESARIVLQNNRFIVSHVSAENVASE